MEPIKDGNRKPNKFARVLIILLSLLIVVIILYNFFATEPRGDINASMIILLAILVVLALSESFDNFSIGKLISISRENKKKEVSIGKLSQENQELRKQIVQVATSVNQRQTSTIISGLSEELLRRLFVKKASEEEIKEKQSEEAASTEKRPKPLRLRPDFRKIEEIAMKRFIQTRKLSIYNLIREAKLVTQFQGIDPVSNKQPIFDGYINTGEQEIFIEIRPTPHTLFFFRERIYVMLNKIHLYRSMKRANAYLALVLVNMPSFKVKGKEHQIDRIIDYFAPALSNNLLQITNVVFSEDEEKLVMRK